MDIGGTAGAVAEPWLLEAPSVFQFPEQIADNGGAAGEPAPESGPVATVPKRFRICQHCLTCGHKMRKGPFKEHHKQFLASGGGQSALYERSSSVLSRGRTKKTLSESSAGNANVSETQIIEGGVNLSRLTSSSSGVSSFFCFCSLIATYHMYATAVHAAYEATA